jgi:transcription elongation factor Elf1
MSFKCGNCGQEFLTRKELVHHMIDVHNSPFIEGEERDIILSKAKLDKISKDASNPRKEMATKQLAIYEDN